MYKTNPNLVMLKILPNNNLEFEGSPVNLGSDNLSKFLLANLSEAVDIAPGVTITELLHIFYNIRNFVTDYCCEDYFTVNAVFSSLELQEGHGYTYVEGYKEIIVSHENSLIRPLLTSFKAEENRPVLTHFRDLEIRLKKTVDFKDHNGNVIKGDMKEYFSLIELVSLFFEELYYISTNTSSDLSLIKMQ